MLSAIAVYYELTFCHTRAPCSLLIIGCATKEDQITPAEAALEKKDQRLWSKEEGRIQ
jgi:hypothetical protein